MYPSLPDTLRRIDAVGLVPASPPQRQVGLTRVTA